MNEILNESKPSNEEDLLAVPKSQKRFRTYIEDKYVIRENDKDVSDKIKENKGFCLSDSNNKCMCDEFKYADEETICKCGRYKKTLRSQTAFLKMRKASFKRGE